jgi:hypothetical protein
MDISSNKNEDFSIFAYNIMANLDNALNLQKPFTIPADVNINEKHLYKIGPVGDRTYFYTSLVGQLAYQDDINKVNNLLNLGALLEDAAFGAGLADNFSLIYDLLERAQTEQQRHAILTQAAKGTTIINKKIHTEFLIEYGANLNAVAEAAGLASWNKSDYLEFENGIKKEFKNLEINSQNNMNSFTLGEIQSNVMHFTQFKKYLVNKELNEQEHKEIFWSALHFDLDVTTKDFYKNVAKHKDVYATIFNAYGFGLRIERMNEAYKYMSESEDAAILEKCWKDKFADQFALGLLQGGHEYTLHQLFKPNDVDTVDNQIKFDECELNDTLIYLANKYQTHPLITYILQHQLCDRDSYLYAKALTKNSDEFHKFNFKEEIKVLQKLLLNHKYSDVKWFANLLLESKYNDKKQYILYQEYLNKFIQIANALENTKKHVDNLESVYNKEIRKNDFSSTDFSSTRNSLTVQKIHAFDNLMNELTPQLVDLLGEIKPKDGIQPNIIKDIKQKALNQKLEEIAKTFKKYEPILAQHRNYRSLIAEITLVFAGLGIGYAVAALINKAATGHYPFFYHETKSTIQLNETKTTIQKNIHQPKMNK